VLEQGRFAELRLAPLAPALANTVALTYPAASASASVTYVYSPALDVPERRTGVGGPIIGERAETIGRGVLNLGLSYSYVRLTRINGEDLDHLVNRPVVNGRLISFPAPDGTMLKDGRFTNFLPVRVVADLGIDAHIVAPSLTYGVTRDLDVNLTLPILRTALDVETRSQIPDPRLPSFALPPGSPIAGTDRQAGSASAAGVGDLLLRAKYLLLRERPVDLAALLGLSLPTGNPDDFQGTGSTRVQPVLAMTTRLGDQINGLIRPLSGNQGARMSGMPRLSAGLSSTLRAATAFALAAGKTIGGEQSDGIDALLLPDRAQRPVRCLGRAPLALRRDRLRLGQRARTTQSARPAGGRDPTIEVEYAFSAPWGR
jgi:hypothetical protein